MEKLNLLYEGKAKKIYRTSDQGLFLVEYKDDATAFNGVKKAQISGKGALNNEISSIFMQLLTAKGIDNHFVKKVSSTEQIVREVKVIPIEVVVRNVAAGSLAKRLGWEEGTALPQPVVEFYYKDDELGDPLINDSHVAVLQIATKEECAQLRELGLRINEVLKADMATRNILLVDFKLEFGKTPEGELILADEISPDTCRFWDAETMEKLDKDRFRRDLGNVEEAYQEILRRLGGQAHV
jgi:phosphoribosylaminoimidazole-succinocarboxamide synthase